MVRVVMSVMVRVVMSVMVIHVGVSVVVSVNVGWDVMVVELLMSMGTILDALGVWGGSSGNWHVDVLGSVGHWLVIGVVGDVSHWLPVAVNFFVVDWLVFGLLSEVLVLWCWLVVVRSLIAVLFLNVCLWLWDLVVVSIELMAGLMMLLVDLGVSIVVVQVVVIGMMIIMFVVVNGWANHWVIDVVLINVNIGVVHNWVGFDVMHIEVADWRLVVCILDMGVVAMITVDGGLCWLVVDVVVDGLGGVEIVKVLLVLAPLSVFGAPLVAVFVVLMHTLLLLGKFSDLGLLSGNLS